MSDCHSAIEQVLDFLEGGLPAGLRRRIHRHLEVCPPCAGFVHSYRWTAELCRRTLLRQAPRDLAERLLIFLRENSAPQSTERL